MSGPIEFPIKDPFGMGENFTDVEGLVVGHYYNTDSFGLGRGDHLKIHIAVSLGEGKVSKPVCGTYINHDYCFETYNGVTSMRRADCVRCFNWWHHKKFYLVPG